MAAKRPTCQCPDPQCICNISDSVDEQNPVCMLCENGEHKYPQKPKSDKGK